MVSSWPAGVVRPLSRAVTVAVMVAVLVLLHALQCATGMDSSPASTASTAVQAATGDAAAEAAPQRGLSGVAMTVDGHHLPADRDGLVAAACLILLVAAGAALLATPGRWTVRVAAGHRAPARPEFPSALGHTLSQLGVSRT
ncbi:hypothetical protein [Micromonospora endolithica]|uniref:Uncharacterized protein n=1 Tax=Micromonospora endolithica TaxID=230091 RepID=A0A3A9ZQA8_9ACTN|nr:hypothetical protein [Micromonospora endolithica]RKN50371.1 hypothetical protein D7223_00760 [Micromonospora endolithica]